MKSKLKRLWMCGHLMNDKQWLWQEKQKIERFLGFEYRYEYAIFFVPARFFAPETAN